MTRHDAFEADLFLVFDAAAQAPIPPGGLERLHAGIADRQPRPARLAGLGGRWIGDPSGADSARGALRARVPVLRLVGALLLLLVTLMLIGTAAVIGGRLLDRPTDPEKLLYGLGGDILLADADGGNPTKVAEGAVLFEGSPWAPDGRHFVSFDTTRLTADIRDPDGQVVGSFANLPGFGGYPVWSPDSTRLQAWTQSNRQINIYGIDGVLQVELPVPEGYTRLRENLAVWAPDGRSVWVPIARVQSYPCTSYNSGTVTDLDPPPCAASEVWELPIDGSASRRVVEDLDFWGFMPSFSRDGTSLAFSGTEGEMAKLYVANADGTDPRAVARAGQGSDQGNEMVPVWSPSGEELAYFVGDDLKVVDIATGTARTLANGWLWAAWQPYSWSRAGDRILFAKQSGPATSDGPGLGDLWTVGVDGGEPTLLVEGATHGAWQP